MRYQHSPTYSPLMHGPVATPLKDLFARRGLLFGTTNGTSPIGTLMAARENSMRVDQGSGGLMGATQAVEGVWNFTNGRAVVDYAVANNLALHHGGHLVWHDYNPGWLSSYTTPSGLRGKLREHMDQTVAAYPEFQSWNVCNEMIATWHGNPGGWRDTQTYEVFGANWPSEFFSYARTLTNKELVWNDNHAIEDAPDDAFNANKAAIITALDAGVPIDTYGMQMHLNGSLVGEATGAQMVDRLNQIAALGLDIRISELDIWDTETRWPIATRRADQVAYVEARLGPIIQQVPALKSVNQWGQNDADSWLNSYLGPRNDGLPREFTAYDRRGFIKPEWWAMFERVTRP